MAGNCNTYQHPLVRDGLSRQDRLNQALLPDQLELMGLGPADWLNFTHEMAAFLRYFDAGKPLLVQGDWQPFWPDQAQVKALLEHVDQHRDLEPHLALFLGFLRLLEHSRGQFNQLSRKHLEFYYRRILQMPDLPHRPDQVHVIFELAQRVDRQQVPKGALLDAGKDALGKELVYATDEELIVNRARIAHLRQIYYQDGQGLLHAPVANSADGLGAELPEENPQWPAFGSAELPAGRIGLALASAELALAQGSRLIRVELQFTKSISAELRKAFRGQFSAYLTGEKEWLGPYQLLSAEQVQVADRLAAAIPEKNTSLAFYLQLDAGEEAVLPYQPEVHGERYNTQYPVLRLLLNEVTGAGDQLYRQLRGLKLDSVHIRVEAYGLRELTVENDVASMDPAKPFLPFGPLPGVGSNFYVGNPEVFTKGWDKIRLNLVWKSKPANFEEHYKAYVTEYLKTDGTIKPGAKALYQQTNPVPTPNADYVSHIQSSDDFKVNTAYRDQGAWVTTATAVNLFDSGTARQITINKQSTSTSAAKGKKNNKNALNHVGKGKDAYQLRSNLEEFLGDRVMPKTTFKAVNYRQQTARVGILNRSWSTFPKKGFLKLELRQHFFHRAFPELHALSLTGKDNALEVPNRPYTPELEELKLDYSASVSQSFILGNRSHAAIFEDFTTKKIQLFHDQVFGQTEEHLFLKHQQYSFPVAREISLLPDHRNGGELLIALDGAEPLQQVSLLFAVMEGSENPLRDPLNNQTGIKWSILSNDEWKPLEPDFKLKDTTNQFLRSGIIRVAIPEEATALNTRLEDGFYWLRARLEAPLDSVSRLQGVYTQAVSATFVNKGNDLGHLAQGLKAGTISKLKDRLARIQKVEQPFPSFGGRPPETNEDYYQRVSERLRHKDRAVNIWDYEQLILQEFPSIYKVKCLSHTDAMAGRELAPGCVSLVIIPRIHPDSAFDRLRPQASQQLLTEVEAFIADRVSMHVRVDAVNAEFETVQLNFGVRFAPEVDASFYQEVLEEELIRFLSPWAADAAAEIRFGGTIYRSGIIQFIENLPYVDYLANLKITHKDATGQILATGDLRKLSASNARAVLVSAASHVINILQTDCP